MSASQILGGTPAALANVTGGTPELGAFVKIESTPGLVGVADSGTANLQILEAPTGRYWNRWIGLPGAGVSRGTLEDWGYASGVPNGSIRYTQYKALSTLSGSLNDDVGQVCLNWGLLDAARSGVLTPANTVGGVFAGPIVSISATDTVWFFPQTIGAAPFVAPSLVSVQPAVGFTINAAIPAGETWRYLVVSTKTV